MNTKFAEVFLNVSKGKFTKPFSLLLRKFNREWICKWTNQYFIVLLQRPVTNWAKQGGEETNISICSELPSLQLLRKSYFSILHFCKN